MTFKNIIRYLVLGLMWSVFIVPFIVSGSMFFPFITGKNFLFRIIVELLFGAWVILACLDKTYRPKWNKLTITFAVFTLIVLLADVFGVNPVKSIWSNFERMEGFVTILHVFLFYIVVTSTLITDALWTWFMATSVGASLIMCMIGFLQLAGVLVISQSGTRLDGQFGNSIYFAVYLLFNIFFTVLLFVRIKWKWDVTLRYIFGASMGLFVLIQTLILYYTATRGTLFGLFGGLVLTAALIIISDIKDVTLRYGVAGSALFLFILSIALFFKIPDTLTPSLWAICGSLIVLAVAPFIDRNVRMEKLPQYVSAGIIGLIALTVFTFIAIKKTDFVVNNSVLSRFATISWNDVKSSGRSFTWPMAVKGVMQKPVLGWGQENFNYVFNANYNPKMYTQEQWFDRVHNVYLDWAIATGIPGAILYILLFAFALWYVWKNEDMSYFEKSVLTGLFAGYAVHNFVVFDNLTSYILFAMTLAYVSAKEKGFDTMSDDSSEEVFTVTLEQAQWVVTPLVIMFISVSMYYVNVRGMMACWSLINAMQTLSAPLTHQSLVSSIESYKAAIEYGPLGSYEVRERLVESASNINGSQASAQDKQLFYDLTKTELDKQLEETPDDARYQLFTGTFYDSAHKYDLGLPHLVKAVELSPQKQTIMFELISNYINTRQFDLALATAKKAFESDQTFDGARSIYAITAIYKGDNKLVEDLLIPRYGTVLVPDDRIVSAYYATKQFDKVAQIFKAKIEKNPTDYQTQLSLGAVYLQMNNRSGAIDQIQKVIELNPSFKKQGDYYISEIKAGRNP